MTLSLYLVIASQNSKTDEKNLNHDDPDPETTCRWSPLSQPYCTQTIFHRSVSTELPVQLAIFPETRVTVSFHDYRCPAVLPLAGHRTDEFPAAFSLVRFCESFVRLIFCAHDDDKIYNPVERHRNSCTETFEYSALPIVRYHSRAIFTVLCAISHLCSSHHLTPNCRHTSPRNPPPVVVWLKNDQVVDDECEHNSMNAIENRLHWPSVSRHDFGSVFTCQASNTKLMDPRQASVVLDLRLPPLTVTFSVMDEVLVADRRYDVQCNSAGSRPPASITWYRNDKKLPKIKTIQFCHGWVNSGSEDLRRVLYTESPGIPVAVAAARARKTNPGR
ncbi:hypothetical protein QTP88_025278 [Uroleucon formosanum]